MRLDVPWQHPDETDADFKERIKKHNNICPQCGGPLTLWADRDVERRWCAVCEEEV